MEEDNRIVSIQNALINVELHPVLRENENDITERFTKLPIGKISAVGTAFEPLVSAFQSIGSSGGSGLYWVNTGGGQMFNSGGGFIGAIKAANGSVGGGQAILNPIALNPTMLFMAIALYNIDKKLDAIQETSKEILEFLERKEKSKLKGDFIYLTDVLNNYKYNWNNEKYKSANHIKVLDIKQSSDQSVIFYHKQVSEKPITKSFFYGDKDVKTKLKKIDSDFEGYQLAVYLHAFSSFLEVMLLENFNSGYLHSVAKKIEDNALSYRKLYTDCYDQIEKYSKSSLESNFVRGLSKINRTVGNAAANIPIVNKSQIDDAFIGSSNRLAEYNFGRTSKNMEQLMKYQSSSVGQFVDNINTVNKLYNEPIELLVDEENIYYCLPE